MALKNSAKIKTHVKNKAKLVKLNKKETVK